MDDFKFQLKHVKEFDCATIGRFDALCPQNDSDQKVVSKIHPFIKITFNGVSGVFKTKIVIASNAVLLSNKNFEGHGLPTDASLLSYQKVSSIYFQWHKIWHDGAQTTAFIGLLIAVAGAWIDGAFTIGKTLPKISVSTQWTAIWLYTALIFKIVGLLLVYFKGIKESK